MREGKDAAVCSVLGELNGSQLNKQVTLVAIYRPRIRNRTGPLIRSLDHIANINVENPGTL